MLPLDVDVAGLFPRQEVAVLQDDVLRVPDDDPQFVPGKQQKFNQITQNNATQISNIN